jgi:hypothetical protein
LVLQVAALVDGKSAVVVVAVDFVQLLAQVAEHQER